MLVFNQASIGYGKTAIVSPVSFTLLPGQLLGIIGPNGGGKTTIARALYGQSDLLAGTIALGGRNLLEMDSMSRAHLIGVVPQSITAPFGLTARQFVKLGDASLITPSKIIDRDTGYNVRETHAAGENDTHAGDSDFCSSNVFGTNSPLDVDALLELTDTKYLANQNIQKLSGGELQRLYVAQALVNNPRILIADEPTSHLDINHRLQMLDMIREMCDGRGLAAMIIFHDFELAARYSDVLSVVSARVSKSATAAFAPSASIMSSPLPPKDVLSQEMFEHVFGVKATITTSQQGYPSVAVIGRCDTIHTL